MTDANNMSHITQTEFEQLVRQDTRRITEPKETVVRKHSHQSHRPCVQESLMAKITQTRMAVNNLNVLTNEDLPQNGERGEENTQNRFINSNLGK